MIGHEQQNRLLLVNDESVFVWSSLVLHFGLPALPAWTRSNTSRRELLKLLERGLRAGKLVFPAENGPIYWQT